MPSEYLIIGKEYCGFCANSKKLLDSKSIEYTYADIQDINSADVAALQEVAKVESFRTVPQIFKYKVGGGLEYIGGYTELAESFRSKQ